MCQPCLDELRRGGLSQRRQSGQVRWTLQGLWHQDALSAWHHHTNSQSLCYHQNVREENGRIHLVAPQWLHRALCHIRRVLQQLQEVLAGRLLVLIVLWQVSACLAEQPYGCVLVAGERLSARHAAERRVARLRLQGDDRGTTQRSRSRGGPSPTLEPRDCRSQDSAHDAREGVASVEAVRLRRHAAKLSSARGWRCERQDGQNSWTSCRHYECNWRRHVSCSPLAQAGHKET
mmetsp:Transcript_78981/g.142496  ORF Transcript_78981/g.142496 Transcript_78981/m.142496 type:complete len:233 (+) Transcript_78981:815-1513(+)